MARRSQLPRDGLAYHRRVPQHQGDRHHHTPPQDRTRNDWAAFAWADGTVYRSTDYLDLDIFDRVGGGDSFASGLVYGLLSGKGAQWALNCGVAHGALVMTTPGDSSFSTLAEVERLMAGSGAGVQR